MGGDTPANDSLNSLVDWWVLSSVRSGPILLLQLDRMLGISTQIKWSVSRQAGML